MPDEQPLYDAAVIGGGPAGLVAATYLARFRRSVLLLDAGHSRAATIPRSHNYPGYPDGVSGVQLVASMREQVGRYAVDLVAAQVQSLGRIGTGGSADAASGFTLAWAAGSARARTVLLATGASDIEPDMPYTADALRAGLLRYCPVCDGFEVIDQAVGVIADGPSGVGEALYLRHYTSRLTVFMRDGADALEEEDRQRLAAAGIALVHAPLQSMRQWNGRITVRYDGGEIECDSVYSALGMRVHSDLATACGAQADASGYLQIDPHHCTTVPGLYAAGDVASGLNQISVASGGASIATAAMHNALRESDPALPG